jgi:protocatechuate 3,4-dioxygenase alpha subunit
MIEKFAKSRGKVQSEFLDLNHTRRIMILVSLFDSEVRSGRQHRGMTNVGIGTLGMSKLRQTPSQTVGPFFSFALTPEQYGYGFASIAGGSLIDSDVPGQRIRLEGRIFDGKGECVPDAMVEIWQADGEGRYAHPADPRGSNVGFKGFGRMGTGTDPEARFIFDTIKPGSVDGEQAPHISVILFARGLLLHAYTRIYFSDEAAANARDPVLASVPAERRHTLIAVRDEKSPGAIYRIDLHMQGPNETVFFDV